MVLATGEKPKRPEVFKGCRSPHRAAAGLLHRLLPVVPLDGPAAATLANWAVSPGKYPRFPRKTEFFQPGGRLRSAPPFSFKSRRKGLYLWSDPPIDPRWGPRLAGAVAERRSGCFPTEQSNGAQLCVPTASCRRATSRIGGDIRLHCAGNVSRDGG